MEYGAAIRFLYDLEHGAIKLGLERIERAVVARGHPQRRYLTVHVAGTNGKGSTCALIAGILEAAGYRTGLLTSPHLCDFRERIRLAGRLIPRWRVAEMTTELAPLIRECELSYFEATTLLAYEAFAREEVDVAVVEVGMGGRLDATNTVSPALTVVTGIGLDHTKSLGATLPAIAGEKAGIMKSGVPLLLGECRSEVREVFLARGAVLGAAVVGIEERASLTGIEPAGGGTRYARRSVGGRREAQRWIRLCGSHQARNALLAEEAARLLAGGRLLDGRPISLGDPAFRAGLAATHWPGRFEFAESPASGVPAILDVAHNPQGAETLVETYARWGPAGDPPTLIVGMLGDKEHAAYFRVLHDLAEQLLLIPLDSPRAGPIDRLADAARSVGFAPQVCAGMPEAWTAARRAGQAVVMTGSFLTVDAAMRVLGAAARESLFAVTPPETAPAGEER